MSLSVKARVERWPIAGKFVISRGARTEAVVIVAEISDGTATGRGECVPYARYGESAEGVLDEITALRLEAPDRNQLRQLLAPGAARNALDCALWDLEAKRTGTSAAACLGIATPRPITTAYTLSLGTPDEMAKAAVAVAWRGLLKVKLGGEGDVERIRAIRAAAPSSTLIVDANEAWSQADLEANMAACAQAGVALIEQPLPAGDDDLLASVPHSVPICADESLHVAADLRLLAGKYDAVNIKLDKTGGLTEALELYAAARQGGFKVMVGCMVGTSLAMAPAVLLAQQADFADLDGPLLLARDREPGLVYSGDRVSPPEAALWG